MASTRSLLVALLLATLLVTLGVGSRGVRGSSASAPLLRLDDVGIGVDVDSGPHGLIVMVDVGGGTMSVRWGWASLLPM